MTIPDSDMVRVNGGSCLPCGPEEEKRIVRELISAAESNLREGDWYYVVSNRWFSGWQKYVGLDSGEIPIDNQVSHSQQMGVVPSRLADRPGPIDNSDIVSKEKEWEGDDLELPRTLEEGRDYVLVPEGVWQKLLNWYTGGPALPRKLISLGDFHKTFNVEVYPLRLKLTDSRDGSQSVIRISKKASIQELYERVFSVKGIKQEKARILDYFNKQKHSVLEISDKTMEASNLLMDQDILLEVQSDGYWPSGLGIDSTGNDLALVPIEPSRSSFTIAGGPTLSNGHSTSHTSKVFQGSSLPSRSTDQEDGYDSLSTISKGNRGGLGGLQNLGNTCFMNSALQCLVHTPPLVEYFLQDYSEEINKQNPLGMHGEIALAFGELLRRLWSCGRTTVAPRVFKGKLARFAPQFSGYNQHDSQELLAFLLDGLHEDLNRVKRKPYIEMKDSDGRPDEEVAEECWRNHKARNDSVIVDVCQGQYKSTLVCPVCGKISITFDPFMYLSLPLPSTVTRTMTITVFYGDGTGLPMPYTVTVLKHGCCKDLIQALGYACCLKTDESLLLAEVYDHRIYRYFENPLEPLSSIKDDEYIVAYRLPKRLAGLTKVELLHRCLEKCTADSLKVGERKLLGTPLVTYVEDPQNEVDIDIAVGRMLSSLKRKTIFSSNTAQNSNEIGTVSVGDARMVDCNTEFESGNQSIDSIESEDTFSSKLSFQLSLIDERGLNCRPVEKHSLLKAGQSVRVMMDWSNREYDLYDLNYLRDLPEVCKSGYSAKKSKQEAISLFSCLEAFLKEEPLGPDDMWYCPSCKEHRQATKKLDLWRLSDILVFHLKRFSYSRYLKNKIDTFVNFPIHNLDLSKYVKSNDGASDSLVYELYAISNHYGGLGGGHYSAYAKIIDENRWYHFDDSLVSPVNEAAIKTAAAYVLFYRRVRTGSKAEKGESRV